MTQQPTSPGLAGHRFGLMWFDFETMKVRFEPRPEQSPREPTPGYTQYTGYRP